MSVHSCAHQTTCTAIQAVQWTKDPIGIQIRESVFKRTFRISFGTLARQRRVFVNDHHVIILVDDANRHVFGNDTGLGRSIFYDHGYMIACAQNMIRVNRFSVYDHPVRGLEYGELMIRKTERSANEILDLTIVILLSYNCIDPHVISWDEDRYRSRRLQSLY